MPNLDELRETAEKFASQRDELRKLLEAVDNDIVQVFQKAGGEPDFVMAIREGGKIIQMIGEIKRRSEEMVLEASTLVNSPVVSTIVAGSVFPNRAELTAALNAFENTVTGILKDNASQPSVMQHGKHFTVTKRTQEEAGSARQNERAEMASAR
jgi:hypothetical protein